MRCFAERLAWMKQHGIRLSGDEVFDKLDVWFEKNELGAQPVRNEAVIMGSAVQALENPVFSSLPPDTVKMLKEMLL